MKHVSILVLQGCLVSGIKNSMQLLAMANEQLVRSGQSAAFEVELVGVSKDTVLENGLFTVSAHHLLTKVEETDLVILPPVEGNLKSILKANAPFAAWIKKQYALGAEIASLCVGSFIVASTGLLNGKKCSTHWTHEDEFRKKFPLTKLVSHKIVTYDNGIYTSGGAFSSLNLLLHIIERYAGRDIAIYCSKAFEIDVNRNSQLPFAIFQPQREHRDEAVKKAQTYIEQHYQSKLSVEQICQTVAVGRRNFERRFRKATFNSIAEYIQRVRVEAAKRLLESSRMSIQDIMLEVGYQDVKSFRTAFKKMTSLTPVDYRVRYNSDAMQAV